MTKKSHKPRKSTPEVDYQGPDSGRHDQVAMAAYFKAEERGFEPGGELQDWLEAEKELERKSAS